MVYIILYSCLISFKQSTSLQSIIYIDEKFHSYVELPGYVYEVFVAKKTIASSGMKQRIVHSAAKAVHRQIFFIGKCFGQ